MKMLLPLLALLLVSITFSATPSIAEDKVELFVDEGRTVCSLSDNTPAVVSLHVFLTGPDNATLVGFKATLPDCWQGATWFVAFGPSGWTIPCVGFQRALPAPPESWL